MADAPDPSGDVHRPDPVAATTPAEFVEAMRGLKQWTGLGYRQLEKRAATGGQALPRSTLTAALARHALPREDLVTAFAFACGCDEDQTAQWISVRRRIAATGTAVAPEPSPVLDETPVVARPPVKLHVKRPVRTAIGLLALAMTATVGTHLLTSSGPTESQHSPGQAQAAPAGPGSSQPQPTTSAPESSTVVAPPPTSVPSTTSPAKPTPAKPVPTGGPPVTVTSGPALPIRFQTPSLPPTSVVETPRVPADPGKDTIQLPGESSIHCPTPYLGTHYGPLAQCTQQSGNQARPGFYSPFTQEFGPMTDWVSVVDKKWYDGSVLATDGVEAWARGYGTVETVYGPGVWATQYRDGEARWGTINLITNRFYPASTGWQPAKR